MGRTVRTRIAYLYLLPAFLLLGVFSYWPFVQAFRLALYRSDGLKVNDFVGLENFATLFQDPLFWHGFAVLGLLALGLPLQVFGPFIGARLIHAVRSGRAAYVYRAALVIPVVVPMMVNVLIWRDFYQPDGAVNELLRALGLEDLTTTWLGNQGTVIPALIFMGQPWIGGINMLLFLAGFITIPKNLYEAARLDGATTANVLWHIEMPMLLPQFRIVTVLAVLTLIQAYEPILVLTAGGPANATMVPGLYLFENAFQFGKVGYAAAVGFVLFAICLLLTVANLRLMRTRT